MYVNTLTAGVRTEHQTPGAGVVSDCVLRTELQSPATVVLLLNRESPLPPQNGIL